MGLWVWWVCGLVVMVGVWAVGMVGVCVLWAWWVFGLVGMVGVWAVGLVGALPAHCLRDSGIARRQSCFARD